MNRNIQIQPANVEHADLYRQLRLQALATDPGSYLDRIDAAYDMPDAFWREDLARPDRRVLLGVDLDDAGTPVAMQAVNLVHNRQALLNGLYVDPDYRGDGLGRRMVEAGIQTAVTEWSPVAVTTEVLHHNSAAMHMFEDMGFATPGAKVVGRSRYGQPFGEYVYTREEPNFPAL
jgi:GNAT superfamily N-acetyltransferase